MDLWFDSFEKIEVDEELLKNFGIDIRYRDIIDLSLAKDIIPKIVLSRVLNFRKEVLRRDYNKIELKYEETRMKREKKIYGVIYDGFLYLSAFKKIVKDLNSVIITDQLIATYDEDRRYHLRIAVLSSPSLISVPGIFSAPTKDKEYHISRIFSEEYTLELAEDIKKEISSIIPTIISTYIIVSHLWMNFGIGFCKDFCMLSDKHNLKELIETRKAKILCELHKKLFF